MNPDKFKDSPSGRVLKVGTGEEAYWSFVPHPLPPALILDFELVRVLSEADRALGELAGLGRIMPNPHLLIGPFLRREAVLSSAIEGTETELMDLYAYEAGQLPLPGLKPPPPESDVQEVANYVRALEYGLERLKTLPVSLRLIRELHERLMAGVRGEKKTPGEFRRSQNWIGAPGSKIEDARYVPPPVAEMNETLDVFEKYLHEGNEHPPLVRLAMIHYQFEAIHPFLDGNGRIGRLLISMLLVYWDLLPHPLLYLSAYFERRRQEYYDFLMGISERGTWREWLLFFLQGVAVQAREANQKVKQLQDLQRDWQRRLKGTRSALLLRVANSLLETPILTIPRVQKTFEVSYPAAKTNVAKLVKAGVLKLVDEDAYRKIYLATEVLEIITEDGKQKV